MLKSLVKKVLKEIIYVITGRGIEKAGCLERYEVISFDIFDTLVLRNASSPQDIFDRAGERYMEEYGIEVKNFRLKRMDAEKKAKKEKNHGEITFNEIYVNLEKALLEEGYSGIDIEKLKFFEVDEEMKACRPNGKWKEIYEDLIRKGKHIILTSDMYLDVETIGRILDKCGYYGYKEIYLSSEKNCTKRDGGLFRLLLENLKVGRGKMVHIGDNPRGDYIVPRLLGVRTLLV